MIEDKKKSKPDGFDFFTSYSSGAMMRMPGPMSFRINGSFLRRSMVRADALGERLLEILLNFCDFGRCIKVRAAFKVVVQAAVVQIDRADGRLAVIADEDLRVNEARLVLINLYTVFKQPAVVRVAQARRQSPCQARAAG